MLPVGGFVALGVALALLGLVIGLRHELRLAVDVGNALASLIPSDDQSETAEPNARSVGYTSRAGDEIPADLYAASADGPGPALILVNGVEVTGRRHPVLVAFAESLARAGFVVLAPEQLGNAAYRLVDRDPDALVAGFEFLARQPEVDPQRIAFVGVSTGGSLSLVAAADPRIADDVAFVATVGSYYSLATLLQAATTGTILDDGGLRPFTPHRYVWGVARNTLVSHLPDATDQRMLYDLFPAASPDPDPDALARTDLDDFTAAGRAVFELFANRDPQQASYRIRRMEAHLPLSLDALSPVGVADGIQAKVRMLHDLGDTYIPSSESKRLLRRLGPRQAVLTQTDVLEHALLDEVQLSPDFLLGTFAPGMLSLFGFTFAALHGL
ncbi:MAG: acetylxylan esterase [Chloroflexi bacterium]|nr:acetylxylan esterase [Chloroflexota bacterium]